MTLSRRDLILQAAAGIGASALTIKSLLAQQTPAHPLKVVVTGGHPGDPEYGCGGTIRLFTTLGHTVNLLYLNNGAWPPTPAAIRMAEATKACQILGAHPLYADQENGHAIVDNAHYETFAKLLADQQPDLVFTQWPIDNHRDHRAIYQLTYDAWNATKRRFALYYYEVSDGEDTMQFSPTHYIDISSAEPAKRAACYAHASQTPDRYYQLQDEVAIMRGHESGFNRAEAFTFQRESPSDPLQILMKR